jgi:hypothetical protein
MISQTLVLQQIEMAKALQEEPYIQDPRGHGLQGTRLNVFPYSLLTLLVFTS